MMPTDLPLTSGLVTAQESVLPFSNGTCKFECMCYKDKDPLGGRQHIYRDSHKLPAQLKIGSVELDVLNVKAPVRTTGFWILLCQASLNSMQHLNIF